ncbi:hypothetical protein AJ80_10077 [Polytolypa hystricis UAMH7299]|uniref:Uncharacterized protein n=1 Tax=Polytolypa hystricis (strain UAMH7299) TaxID=1447883 RepID=A0A2B7W622_POLH7|nr:hypothetical protein AJ80_10077 [Polytolypa hystricis UAMH7299]
MSENSEKIVEERGIPNQALYDKALNEHESLAKDLTRPKTADYVVLTVFENGWHLLTEAEKVYAISTTADRSEYRPSTSNKYRRNVTVFFPGIHVIGKPYMALIPFYVSGDVKIEGRSIRLRSCYDIYGSCDLEIPTNGKLGAFLMLDVK